MFSSSSISSDLPSAIMEFINKHHISIINDEGRFGGGADYVFSFLFPRATADVVGCAYSNLEYDNRFNAAQKAELKSLIVTLCETGIYNVPVANIESPRLGR